MPILKRSKGDFIFESVLKDEYCISIPHEHNFKVGDKLQLCIHWYSDDKPIDCVVTFSGKYVLYVKEKRWRHENIQKWIN